MMLLVNITESQAEDYRQRVKMHAHNAVILKKI